jgi:hypothetical protein
MTTTQQMAQAQVLISLDDFADDLANLGYVNGNILHRLPSVPGVHDGQLLVRLKKKRFVLLDYSIRPNDADLEQAAMHAHIKIPKSVGKVCSRKEVRSSKI